MVSINPLKLIKIYDMHNHLLAHIDTTPKTIAKSVSEFPYKLEN